MKVILLSLILAFALPVGAFDHSGFDRILKAYVDKTGQVNYSAIKSNRAGLDAYLKATGAVSESRFDSWNESTRLAFLINVYNAETLQYIIDNYPVDSIKDLGGFLRSPWGVKNVTLHGEMTTLNHLEHQIIRKDFAEPRIHFALVCAAVGCPPLRNEAFTGARLDAQLESQTRAFLSQSEKNRVEGGKLYLSQIFKWYGEDFEDGDQTVASYVDPYYRESTADMEIEYTDYDWSLNDRS